MIDNEQVKKIVEAVQDPGCHLSRLTSLDSLAVCINSSSLRFISDCIVPLTEMHCGGRPLPCHLAEGAVQSGRSNHFRTRPVLLIV